MKIKVWEMKLSQPELDRFETVLAQLIEGNEVGCPGLHGAAKHLHPEVCNNLCGKLFPSLERAMRENQPFQRAVRCPCFTISTRHKINTVRKLLTFNGRRPK